MSKKYFSKNLIRLMTAVFLFVVIVSVIYPSLPVLAADSSSSDSSSDNDTDEEYTWDEALNDEEYKENLADLVARYFATNWVNYVGTSQEIVNDISDLIGETYDNSKDLYDNLYPYLLPYSQQTVNNLDLTDIKPEYGKPHPGQNNINLINDVANDLGDNLSNLIPNGGDLFTELTNKKKNDGDLIYYDIFPNYFFFSKIPKMFHGSPNFSINGKPFFSYFGHYSVDNGARSLDLSRSMQSRISAVQFEVVWIKGSFRGDIGMAYITDNNKLGWYSGWDQLDFYMNIYNTVGAQFISNDDYRTIYGNVHGDWDSSKPYGSLICGDAYIVDNIVGSPTQNNVYFWDQSELQLYYMGNGNPEDIICNPNNTGTSIERENTTINIYNTIDFDEYTDLINQMMLDVNMSNNVTNSLLIELIKELRNQNNNYVQQDDDDIYDYIDYMTQKLTNVKDIHIEIPDITPDLGGIADGISALLNFLASIIRAIGDIVSSLLDGLFHLIVPTQQDWDELTIQFNTMTAPLDWIKEFFEEAASAISMCLFGRNVTDYELPEMEPEEVVNASMTKSVKARNDSIFKDKIEYDPDSGAPKIPVHFSNSTSEYFSNISDCYIIDMNWYTPFKPVGDIIVVAFCWIMFIWRTLHDLPNIIAGASGMYDNSGDPISTQVKENRVVDQMRNFTGVGRK